MYTGIGQHEQYLLLVEVNEPFCERLVIGIVPDHVSHGEPTHIQICRARFGIDHTHYGGLLRTSVADGDVVHSTDCTDTQTEI